tara:strand:- start:171 stop:422 length:252 start_codon:yes stop_codon:yes gene_type:complete
MLFVEKSTPLLETSRATTLPGALPGLVQRIARFDNHTAAAVEASPNLHVRESDARNEDPRTVTTVPPCSDPTDGLTPDITISE